MAVSESTGNSCEWHQKWGRGSLMRLSSYGANLSLEGCPNFWHLWATLEEEELSWATH